jgi:hypothetical protein
MVEAVSKIFRCLPLLLAILGSPARALAHQLDEYLQATLVAIEPGEIRLQMNLTPGVAVADKVLASIDRNHDGKISTNESIAYAESLKRDLVVQLDGRNVELKLAAWNYPDPEEIRTGWGIIQLEYSAMAGALAAGPHKLTFENRHQPVASAYLFNAERPESATIKISGQKRNENQSMGEIAFDFQPPKKPFLTAGVAVLLAAMFVVLSAGVWQARKTHKNVVLTTPLPQ